jgi:hypothetical protein
MEGSDIQFENMDSWKGSSGKFGLTFKQILLMHINRCVQNCSVEWRGGFMQKKYKQNYVEEFYVPSTRETYNNSVICLRALLLGYFDKKMQEADKKLKDAYSKELLNLNAKLSGKLESNPEKKLNEDTNLIENEWYLYKVNWHIRLFEELILLGKRLNFFEETGETEEDI